MSAVPSASTCAETAARSQRAVSQRAVPQRAVPKFQRWIDLLAALLVRRGVVTFQQLEPLVPDYGDPRRGREARQRMFDRDKDELRAFGVPIETVEGREGDDVGYRLRPEDFYLPYLALAAEQGAEDGTEPGAAPAGPRKVDAWGYHALRSLAFEPDELAAVADAAARVRALGDPALAGHVAGAVRKLAFDLPFDDADAGDAHLVAASARPDPALLDLLGRAVLERRRVAFDYHALGRDETARRTVEPWGMFYLSGHWYLAGCDRARGADDAGLRNFRVSRMHGAALAGRASEPAPQYAVPAGFRLRTHAQSRQAWELGDGDAALVTVAFARDSGATHAALALGEVVALGDAVAGTPEPLGGGGVVVRGFRVRRPEAFVRWLLGFAGEARPLAPPSLVAAYAAEVAAVRALYRGADGAAADGAA